MRNRIISSATLLSLAIAIVPNIYVMYLAHLCLSFPLLHTIVSSGVAKVCKLLTRYTINKCYCINFECWTPHRQYWYERPGRVDARGGLIVLHYRKVKASTRPIGRYASTQGTTFTLPITPENYESEEEDTQELSQFVTFLQDLV